MTDYGELLRSERSKRGLKLKEVAEGANVSVSALSLYERNLRVMPVDIFDRICQFFGIEMELKLKVNFNCSEKDNVTKFTISFNSDEKFTKEDREIFANSLAKYVDDAVERFNNNHSALSPVIYSQSIEIGENK